MHFQFNCKMFQQIMYFIYLIFTSRNSSVARLILGNVVKRENASFLKLRNIKMKFYKLVYGWLLQDDVFWKWSSILKRNIPWNIIVFVCHFLLEQITSLLSCQSEFKNYGKIIEQSHWQENDVLKEFLPSMGSDIIDRMKI